MDDFFDPILYALGGEGRSCSRISGSIYSFTIHEYEGLLRESDDSLDGCMWDSALKDYRLARALDLALPPDFSSVQEYNSFVKDFSYREFSVPNSDEGIASIIELKSKNSDFFLVDDKGSAWFHLLPFFTMYSFGRAAEDLPDSDCKIVNNYAFVVDIMKVAAYVLLYGIADSIWRY